MKISELLVEGDPKHLIRTMDAGTFRTLADLNQWEKEREAVRRTLSNERSREWRAKRREQNSIIVIGGWGVPVDELERWLETKDDQSVVDIAIKKGWGLPRDKALRSKVIEDPEYRETILDIWLEAARMYSGRPPFPYSGAQDPYSTSMLERRLSIIGRRARLALHVDKHGLRLSPHLPHPESNLPTTWVSRSR